MSGRPREEVPKDIADALCDWIAEGKPLRAFCRQPGMPAWRTVYAWMEDDGVFRARVGRARDIGFAALAEECLDVADDASNDWMERSEKRGGGWEFNGDHVQRSKLRIETRLKLLACWDPRRYGQKTQISGPDGAGLVLRVVTGLDAAGTVEGPDDLLPNPETPEVSE